jgi:hypothetical protein
MLNKLSGWARAFALGSALAAAPAAHAFGPDDAGIYTVFDKAGKQTDIAYRFYTLKDKWVAEERAKDGSWKAFECKSDCEVLPMSQVDMNRVFGKMLDFLSASCISNSNFAICSYALKSGAAKSGYLMAVLSPKGPVLLHIVQTDKLQ